MYRIDYIVWGLTPFAYDDLAEAKEALYMNGAVGDSIVDANGAVVFQLWKGEW